MTDGQDYGQSGQYPQPGQYPRPGYGQQNGPQGQPWPQPGYGQQYPPEDQPWGQPQNDPRPYRRRHGGPPEEPWQQAPYPPQDYPQQAPYPPRDYPQPDYPQPGYPPRGQWQQQQPQQDFGQFQPPRQGHHRKRSRTPLYAGVAALIVIAGGGTAYALAGHGGTPSPKTGGTTQAAAKPASLSQLKKIVLQRADVPSSWKAAPYQPDPNDAANNAALMRCVGARDTDSDKVAEANSDNFNLGNASIASSATSYRSQSDLTSDVATLHSPKLSACFGQMMKKELAASLPKGATTTSASIKITPGSAGGPANVVATGTGTIDIQLNGQQVQAYLTVAFITGPLIEAEVDAENVGSPVSASVVKPLVAAVANRAATG